MISLVKAETSARMVLGMSRAQYDGLAGHNFSALKHLDRSPAAYKTALALGSEDKAAFVFGRVAHLAVFEPDSLPSSVAVWDGGVRRGKEWDAFVSAHSGKEILKSDEFTELSALALAVRQKPSVRRHLLAKGHAEPTFSWEEEGLPLKGRADWVSELGIVELKTTRDASPAGFGRECAQRNYHVQAAMYSDAYEAAHGRRLPYFIVAAEKSAAHDVVVYRVSEELLNAGRERYRAWLGLLKSCVASGAWPGADTGLDEMPLVLPAWSVPIFEDAAQ